MLIYAKSSKILHSSRNVFTASVLFSIIGGCLRIWKELVVTGYWFGRVGSVVG